MKNFTRRCAEIFQKPEYLFIALYLIIGIFSLIFTPIMRVPDEPGHFLRAYEISAGNFVSKVKQGNGHAAAGNDLPVGLLPNGLDCRKLTWSNFSQISDLHTDYTKERFYGFSNISLYSPTNYLPQAVGIAVARPFTDSSMILMYAGRFANWLFAGVCLFWSLRLLPRFKWLLFAVIFLPMSLHQLNSLSADCVLIALAAFYTSFVFYLRSGTEPVRRNQIVLLYVMAVALSLTKMVYLPMTAIAFLVPAKKFSSKKQYWLVMGGLLAASVAANLLWLRESAAILAASHVKWADPVNQTLFILQHPIEYVKVFLRTVWERGRDLTYTMLGASLGWLDVPTGHKLMKACGVTVLLMALCEGFAGREEKYPEEDGFSVLERLFLTVVCGAVIVLIATALYIQWTPLQNPLINGMQGRYFLPILFPLLVAVTPYRLFRRVPRNAGQIFLILCLFAFDLLAFWRLTLHSLH